MASVSSCARTLLSRSLAASRQAMRPIAPPKVVPRVGLAPHSGVLWAPRSNPMPASTRWHSSLRAYSSSSSSSSTPSTPSSPSSAASSSSESSAPATPEADSSSPALEAPEPGAKSQPIGQIEPRLQITFTCQAGPEKGNPVCGHRSSHEFAKKSYEKGVVIIQCPECEARHLIADHLGWFSDVTDNGKHKTVEDLVRAKGEKMKKGRVTMDGTIEVNPDAE